MNHKLVNRFDKNENSKVTIICFKFCGLKLLLLEQQKTLQHSFLHLKFLPLPVCRDKFINKVYCANILHNL